MPIKRRRFQRPLGEKRYKKLFVISVEGAKTEPEYFAIFNMLSASVVKVHCLKCKHSSPQHVLKRMKSYLKQESLGKSDEAWLVVDKDEWHDEQLNQLLKWCDESLNYNLALSNPKFEFWILLHFEDGYNILHARECSNRLKQHLPGYEKSIDLQKISKDMILQAIMRAKQRDTPPCIDWPRKHGSTVYRLVEKIFEEEKKS